jgi:hypothetical protein
MKFTIHYKDHVGRKNKTEFSGKDYIEAEKKFRTLYVDCVITSIETEDLKTVY